ncbi:MAG: hypothetical protein IJN51_01930 [Alistipes sp.]|nr:hypothetical protein [Alistipes sp.]
MKQPRRISQGELKYVYESAQARMEYNPEIAAKYKKIIEEHPFYKSEKDALKAVADISNKERQGCQIWAKIGVDEEYFYIQDYFIVSADNRINIAAEYVGMAQIF